MAGSGRCCTTQNLDRHLLLASVVASKSLELQLDSNILVSLPFRDLFSLLLLSFPHPPWNIVHSFAVCVRALICRAYNRLCFRSLNTLLLQHRFPESPVEPTNSNMRYGDWDILLFPRDGKVPLKEFKVACHMVKDPGLSLPPPSLTSFITYSSRLDFSNNHLSIGLPTLCCFVPSLSPGSSFQVSVHCWSTPTPSQFTKTYTKHSDAHVFEARVFIDGQVVAYVATSEYLVSYNLTTLPQLHNL